MHRRLARVLPIEAGDFWRLWYVGLVLFVVRWLEMLVMAVFTYRQTHSPFLVAVLTMLRLLPMALFGAVMGAMADRLERRSVLVVVVLCLLATSATLAALAHLGVLQVWHLAAATFINGTAWATDNPVRRIMIGDVAGAQRIGMAMSIDIGTNNASRMLGPLIGGTMLAAAGIDGTFMLSVACYATAAVTCLGLGYRNTARAHEAGSLRRRIGEGVAIVRGDKRLIGTLVITVIFNVFAWPFTSMIPVIGQDHLGLGPGGIGVLASMDGLGAFAGAIGIALGATPARYARLYLGGTAGYLALLPIFAFVSAPLLAGCTLLMTGVASAAFTIMQSTLIYLLAPQETRSRVFGVLSVCIGMGPIGFVHLGLLADAIGPSAAVATVAVEGMIALALTFRYWRFVLRAAAAA